MMKKNVWGVFLVCLCLPLAALHSGDKAAELPRLKFLSGVQRSLTQPLPNDVLRVVTFVLTRAGGARGTVGMLGELNRLYRGRIEQTLITPDPESDAASLISTLKNSGIAFALDNSRRITMQYMGGSLLYPQSFVINREGVIIWSGESVDLGEMLQEYFSGKFDAAAAARIAPMLAELQTLLRESSERKMKVLTDKIFAISPAHPGALRMRLFALENSGRIPQAWELINDRIRTVPGNARLYFTAVDFISRYAYFQPRLREILAGFEKQVTDPGIRCSMAWELLRRFQYNLTALEFADRILGRQVPAQPGLRRIWYSGRAQVAYLMGDLPGAIRYQEHSFSPVPGSSGRTDPMLEYFRGVEKLGKGRPRIPDFR